MKNTFLLTILIIFLTITSCIKDDSIPSCLQIDKVSDGFGPTEVQVGSSKAISFKITNSCERSVNILNVNEGEDIHNEFLIQNVTNNTSIPEAGLIFNVLFSPKSTGNKTIEFSIKTIQGTMIVNLGTKGI